MPPVNSPLDNNDLEQEFRALADQLVQLLASAGIKTQAYHSDTPYFKALSPEQKNEALTHLRFYAELCSSQVLEGMSLRDSQTFTWRAMKQCGLTPGADLLSRISKGDIVEIYSLNNIQIFRNLEFFEFCSYTLEDLYCREWWELFERDPAITDMLMKCAGEIFSGMHAGGIINPTEQHSMKEKASSQKFKLEMQFKFIAPLYSNNAVKALVCIEAGKFVA